MSKLTRIMYTHFSLNSTKMLTFSTGAWLAARGLKKLVQQPPAFMSTTWAGEATFERKTTSTCVRLRKKKILQED